MAENRTALFSRKQSGGVWTVDDLEQHPGAIWFVNSGATYASNAAGYGRNPDKPFATLDYAIGNCTASAGDVIYVMPGHAETWSSAALSAALDVIGVKVVGLGWGTLKPTFTYTHVDATLSITGANCWVENIRLVANLDNVKVGITAGALADGLTLKNVEMADTASNKEFLIDVQIAAACNDVTIDGLRVLGLGGGATQCIVTSGVSNNLTVKNCRIIGTFSTALLDINAVACTNVAVFDNFLLNEDTAAGLVIKGVAATTGFVCRNFVMGVKNNTETINTPGNLHFAENYGTDTVATSGILTPSTLTAWS